MRALVVEESAASSTRRIADAIAGVLAESFWVTMLPPEDVGPGHVVGADLLLVGATTPRPLPHAHLDGDGADGRSGGRLVLAGSDADGALLSEPLRRWFRHVGHGGGRAAAAFDTCVAEPAAPVHSAAFDIEHQLRLRGFEPTTTPGSFLVDAAGDLLSGEEERAREWAAVLVAAVAERRRVGATTRSRTPMRVMRPALGAEPPAGAGQHLATLAGVAASR